MRTFGCWRERGGLEYSEVTEREALRVLEREREALLEYSEVVEALWVLERERERPF